MSKYLSSGKLSTDKNIVLETNDCPSLAISGNEQRYVFVADFGARHCQTTMKFEASYNR